jgi:hypothetical protein
VFGFAGKAHLSARTSVNTTMRCTSRWLIITHPKVVLQEQSLKELDDDIARRNPDSDRTIGRLVSATTWS